MSARDELRLPHSPRSLPVLPEIVLAVGAMVLLMVGAIARRAQFARRSTALASSSCCWSALSCCLPCRPDGTTLFGGSFVVDDFARFLKLLALVGSAGALILSLDYLDRGEAAEIRISAC